MALLTCRRRTAPEFAHLRSIADCASAYSPSLAAIRVLDAAFLVVPAWSRPDPELGNTTRPRSGDWSSGPGHHPIGRRPSSGTTSRSSGEKPSTDPPSVSAGISMPKSSPVISPGHCWFIPLDGSFPSPAWLLISAMIFARDGYYRREILDAGIKVELQDSHGQIHELLKWTNCSVEFFCLQPLNFSTTLCLIVFPRKLKSFVYRYIEFCCHIKIQILIHGFIIWSYLAMISRRMASAHHDQLIGDILGTVFTGLQGKCFFIQMQLISQQ